MCVCVRLCVCHPLTLTRVVRERSAILNQPVGTEKRGQTQNDVTAGIQPFNTPTFSLWTCCQLVARLVHVQLWVC